METSDFEKIIQDFENRQRLFVSQRLESSSKMVMEYVKDELDGLRAELKEDMSELRTESKGDIAGVLAASAKAHTEIINRLERLEQKLS